MVEVAMALEVSFTINKLTKVNDSLTIKTKTMKRTSMKTTSMQR